MKKPRGAGRKGSVGLNRDVADVEQEANPYYGEHDARDDERDVVLLKGVVLVAFKEALRRAVHEDEHRQDGTDYDLVHDAVAYHVDAQNRVDSSQHTHDYPSDCKKHTYYPLL